MPYKSSISLNPCRVEYIFKCSHAEWYTMWILISWLHQKPADLDQQCYQKRINPGSAGQALMKILLQYF